MCTPSSDCASQSLHSGGKTSPILAINTAHRSCAGARLGSAGSGAGGIAWPSGTTPGLPSPVVAGSARTTTCVVGCAGVAVAVTGGPTSAPAASPCNCRAPPQPPCQCAHPVSDAGESSCQCSPRLRPSRWPARFVIFPLVKNNTFVYYLMHELEANEEMAGATRRVISAWQGFALEGVSERQAEHLAHARHRRTWQRAGNRHQAPTWIEVRKDYV